VAKVLVVDDNALNRKLLVALLSQDGHVTFEASDGVDGLQAARAAHPQLVISDILMPSMDGYAFVRQLRADPDLHGIPVLFYTAHYHGREAHTLADSCRVARVLVKPSPAADILAAVQEALTGVGAAQEKDLTGDFDRAHLLLMTNKLSEKADALAALNARFVALAEMNREIVGERDPHVMLRRVCAAARNLIGARYAVLAVRHLTGQRWPFFAVNGIDFGGKLPEPPQIDTGALGEVLATGRSCRIFEADDHCVSVGLPDSYPAAGAFLIVPLSSPSRTYGWICLADKIGADGFDDEDERVLLALTLQTDRLFRSDQFLNRVYSVLRGFSSLPMRVRTRRELCEEACSVEVKVAKFELACVAMLDTTRGHLLPYAAAGFEVENLGLAAIFSSGAAEDASAMFANAIHTRRPSTCNDLTDPACRVSCRAELLTRGYRAVAALPLFAAGKPVGCLALMSQQQGVFDDTELRLQIEVAGAISGALGHALPEDNAHTGQFL
jgi:CheY-like chemotaxis protein/GAF domain-containing protein